MSERLFCSSRNNSKINKHGRFNGLNTIRKKAIELYKQLSSLLAKAGMHARKWLSNSSFLLSVIYQNDRKAEIDLDRNQLPSAKTFGVWWVADRDEFTGTG